MNKIYQHLLKTKINNFINEFYSSRDLFEDLGKRNKLLHPGEFGTYRENICDELIKFSIPSKYNTGKGFLINSFDEVSTQCDIVVYDFNSTPLIENDSKVRFFPVESVVAIGEIKSKLTTTNLCEAIVKLSEIKKMKKIPHERVFCINDDKHTKFEPNTQCHDTIFTFLICEEIERFNSNTVFEKINQSYVSSNIEYAFRHNIIFSIKDGVLTYNNQFNLSKNIKENQKMYVSSVGKYKFENCLINKGNYENFIYLLSSLSNFLMNVNIYYPEPNCYK